MNVLKLTEGIKDTGKGLQGCAVYSRPIFHDIKTHKAELEKDNASPAKKWFFLAGFTALHVLEHWKDMKQSVMEVKDGVLEIVQAIKEPGLPDDKFEEEKDKYQNKQYDQCEALPPRKPKEPKKEPKSKTPDVIIDVKDVIADPKDGDADVAGDQGNA